MIHTEALMFFFPLLMFLQMHFWIFSGLDMCTALNTNEDLFLINLSACILTRVRDLFIDVWKWKNIYLYNLFNSFHLPKMQTKTAFHLLLSLMLICDTIQTRGSCFFFFFKRNIFCLCKNFLKKNK